MIIGFYLFAEASGWLGRTVMKQGDRGRLLFRELVHSNRLAFLLIWLPVLIAMLFALDQYTTR